jgi:hypothetical protein
MGPFQWRFEPGEKWKGRGNRELGRSRVGGTVSVGRRGTVGDAWWWQLINTVALVSCPEDEDEGLGS